MYSLFVHVPPFSKVSKETQLECLNALFELLATCLLQGCWEDDGEEDGKEEKKEIQKGNKSLRKLCTLM
jgi:hypothetical protein